MSTKKILLALGAVIIIGGAIYFASTKNVGDFMMKSENTSTMQGGASTTPQPTKEATSESIIDYLIDGIAGDDTKAAEASIDQTTPASQGEANLNTNF